MIATLTDFQSEPYKIPNSAAAPNGADYTAEINTAIDNYEREILIDGLGVTLYNTLTTEYADFQNASQVIKDLVSGKEYTYNGVSVIWDGLKPMILNYVYYMFLKEHNDFFTTMGVQKPQAVNSVAVSPAERAVKYYNDFLKRYQGRDCKVVYRDAIGRPLNHTASTPFRSLYQYLVDNVSSYPNANNFAFRGGSNIFSI